MQIKTLFTLSIFVLMNASAFCQKADASKYADIVNSAALKKHLSILASDSLEGRETGTIGQRKAADYIKSQFKKIGLKAPENQNGYEQFFPLLKDSLIASSLTINGEDLLLGIDFYTPLSFNETNKIQADKIVFAGYGIDDRNYSDYTNLDVKGNVVLIFSGKPKKELSKNDNGETINWNFSTKLKTAFEKGAVGVLLVDPNADKISASTMTRNKKTNRYFPEFNAEKNEISNAVLSHQSGRKIVGDDFDNILQTATNGYSLTEIKKEWMMSLNYRFAINHDTLFASNVLGVIEGTDKKDEYVFLTAHYDHLGKKGDKVFNGADDDGSGTVAVIQMAAAFAKAKKEGNGPRRTVVFMTVSGEEKGLWGSEYYSDHPIYPLEKTTVDLNTDMIGRVDTERKKADTLNYVYVVGHDKISSELPIINETANNNHTKLVLDYKFDDPNDPNRIYYRSDHYNFARKGVPVLFFYDGMLQGDYHKTTDDIEFINWPLFEKRAQMIFYTAWEIANRNEQLKRDKPLPSGTR